MQTSLTFQRQLTITRRKVFGIRLGKKTLTHTEGFNLTQNHLLCMSYVQNRRVKVSFGLVKCPKLWLLWPWFCQSWGQNERNREKTVHRKQKRGSNWFSHLRGVSPPILDLPYLCPLPSFLFY